MFLKYTDCMKRLYFVRHGLSIMNEKGIFSGRTETPLSEAGRQQATEAGKILKEKSIDRIIVSPMERAVQTAEIIADEIGFPRDKMTISDLLMERDFGPLEGTPYEPHLGDEDGVEPIEDLIERAQEAYRLLLDLPEENIVVVSHGAVGRALRHCAHPEIPFRPSKGFDNAEVVQLL